MSSKNFVVIGGGIQGTSVAYHLAERGAKVTLLESVQPASAASGKGGGFMARSWGDGSPTQRLHELSFDMYETMAKELGCASYRKLPVLSVDSGKGGLDKARKNKQLASILPEWLNGAVGRVSALGLGDDTAQITPTEFVNKMLEHHSESINVILGTCVGVDTEQLSDSDNRKVTAVRYQSRTDSESICHPADAVIVAAGPWSCAAEDWFPGSVKLPMEGIKSTSIVWKKPESGEVDGTALFCGTNHKHHTELEVYPRPDGTVYVCGVGDGDSHCVSSPELKAGAYRDESGCDANKPRADAAAESFCELSPAYKTAELDKVQCCMRPCPPDATPYIGAIPGYEGAYINAGHNCWGIAWAPACGKAIAELVLDGESTSVNLEPFDPARFTPNAKGNRGRKKKGQNVGEQW